MSYSFVDSFRAGSGWNRVGFIIKKNIEINFDVRGFSETPGWVFHAAWRNIPERGYLHCDGRLLKVSACVIAGI
jgi:hypothetical protein